MKTDRYKLSPPRLISSKIVITYAIVSGFWIYFSDLLLALLVDDSRIMSRIAMMKGWLFVLVTSTLLFFLIRRYVMQINSFNTNLLESERRFRELMERVHMIAIVLDKDANITFCNDFLLQLTGWSRQDVMGNNWFDIFIPDSDRADVERIFFQGISNKEFVTHYENGILDRNGTVHIIVWDNTLLRDAAGSVVGIAGLGSDVTEHRQLEAQLLQSQKMESIGTLAGGIAHDFNNILTVIMSCAAMLRLKPDDHERARQLTGLIESSSHKAADLTRSLLAFSRKQQILPKPLDLNVSIFSMREFLERIIGEDVALTMELCEQELAVLADKGQIEQVIMNLVSNARDAMPDGGTLTIKTGTTQLNNQILTEGGIVSGKYAFLKIADSGTGIAKHERERIFEPFYTTKDIGKGTGLGLSMAYGIIRQHNGWITVDSVLGKGSSFVIHLPLVKSTEKSSPKLSNTLRKGHGTILLVEDDEQVLTINQLVLESGGYKVITARNAQDALDRYQQHTKGTVDLAVIDVIMPGMNGKQLYDELKILTPAIKVLFVSGYTADVLDRKNLPAGCAFSQKPLKPQDFLQLVQDLLSKSAF